VSERPIHLVLDTSSILAYTQGSIHVGEVIAEVDDNGGAVALPAACLIAAHQHTADRDRLWVLLRNPAAVVMVTDAADWEATARLAEPHWRVDAACAALIAADEPDAMVLTRQPSLYTVGGEDFPVIGF
jgi:hypothetical protein